MSKPCESIEQQLEFYKRAYAEKCEEVVTLTHKLAQANDTIFHLKRRQKIIENELLDYRLRLENLENKLRARSSEDGDN